MLINNVNIIDNVKYTNIYLVACYITKIDTFTILRKYYK